MTAARVSITAALPGCRSLERIDHTQGLEGFQSRHVLRVENVHASFDARREDEGVPQRNAMQDVQLPRMRQVGRGRQYERKQVSKFCETVPGLSWGKALFAQLARHRQELARHLPEEDLVRVGSD